MASYLETYGEGHEQKSKIRKRVIYGTIAAILIATAVYLFFHNRQQKLRVERFVELLRSKDYPAAYALWGCTPSTPCPDYKFDKFMEDWGPASTYATINAFGITKARSCGSGVIIHASFGEGKSETFWVEGEKMTIGFSPWPVCPPSP